jgi:hemoglobin
MDSATTDVETAIAACVDRFYAKAIDDPLLGPMFMEAIPNLPDHLGVIRDFWSNALLGTGRYRGSPYQAHVRLPIELEHFDRWLELFCETARESLPASYADRAIAKARHMTQSIRVGMFPFTLADGRPSRTPA